MKCDVFWLENPKNLFCNMKLLPKEGMTLGEQLNSITRLVILLFLVFYLVGYKQSFLFLLFSIIFIIIIYYLQKSKMSTCENFTPYNKNNMNVQNKSNNYGAYNSYIDKSEKLYKQSQETYVNKRYTVEKTPSLYVQEAIKPYVIEPNQSYKSINQKLVGDANPKTKIAPINVAPIYEWTYWKENDFVFPSIINERRTQDFYQSGYYPESYDQPPSQNTVYLPTQIVENFTQNVQNVQNFENNEQIKENFVYIGGSDESDKSCRSCSLQSPYVNQIQLTNGDFSRFEQKKGDEKLVRYSGDVNQSCGYDDSNLLYNLPTNYSANNCQREQRFSEINDQIFTSTVTPGVYYKNEIIEPLNWNIGISFDQQIPPRKITYDENGDKIYTGMDPRLYTPIENPPVSIDVPSTYDVYDPRSNGYGTSYRQYVDKLTGRPRFFYDDVDAIRKPNYVIRSNIDHLRNADTYGPVKSDEEIEEINKNIRLTAEKSFSDQTVDFRTDMMTRLMRKKNAEQWQNRMAPKSAKQFTLGSKRC